MDQDSSPGPVIITGAGGFIGSNLVSWLNGKGIQAKCLLRPGTNSSSIMQQCGAKEIYADLTEGRPLQKSLVSSVAGSPVLINLVGSVAPRRGESLDRLHVGYTKRLIELCRAAGIKKMLMVTTLGAAQSAGSKYQTAKWKAEQELINSGINYVIFQPSLVYGRRAGSRDSKLVKRYMDLIAEHSTVPLIGGGHNRLQPVFIDDLVHCITLSLACGKHDNGVLEIGGNEVVELRYFVELLMRAIYQVKPLVDMPVAVAYSIAAVCELTQKVPLLSRDQIALSMHDNVCRNNALTSLFAVSPTSLTLGIKTYAQSAH